MTNYELSIWTHDDNLIMNLKTNDQFEGQAIGPKYIKNVNGQESLSFQLPLYFYSVEEEKFIENPAWTHVISERKVRLIREKGTANESVHDFVIKNYSESREGHEKILSIDCKSYSMYELGRIGYTGVFSEELLYAEDVLSTFNIDFWVGKILLLTKNVFSGLNPSGWQFYIDTPDNHLYEKENISDFEFVDGVWEPVHVMENGEKVDLEKERIIKGEKSNVFNLIQEIAEKFQVWAHFVYTYDKFYRVVARTVVFREEVNTDAMFSINYQVNSDKISRDTNSDDLVTKLYVEPIDSEFEDDGIMSISRAPQNLMMEDFLYNFDFQLEKGYMTDDQYAGFIQFQYNIRQQNINYRPKSLNLISSQKELNENLAKLQFIEYEIAAVEENIRQLTNNISIYPENGILVQDYIFVVEEVEGQFFADISIKKGARTSGYTIKKFDFSPASVSIAAYIRAEDDPLSAAKLRFSANPDPATNRVRLTFRHDPMNYFNRMLRNENSKRSSLLKQQLALEDFISEIEIDISALQAELTTIRNNKKILIDAFETEFHSLIQEGNWRNNEYVLRKLRENISPVPIQYTAELKSAYPIEHNLNNVDFSTVRAWLTNDSYEYFPYIDFTLKFGTVNGVKRLLIVPEENGAFFTNMAGPNQDTRYTANSQIKVRYQTLAGIPAIRTLTLNSSVVWNRYFDIPEENILPSTIRIYTASDKSPLVINTDYSYEVFDNYSRVTLKHTEDATHLDNYYEVVFDTNNTTKFFFQDAKDILERSSKPKVDYSVNFIDLSSLEGFVDFNVDTGFKIPIHDFELFTEVIYGFVSEIQYDLEYPENNTISISNYVAKFEDLFQRIVAASEQLAARSDSYERAATLVSPNRIINKEILQRSLLENNVTLSAGTDTTITWDQDGMTLTDNTGLRDIPGQVKIIGNGIFLSNSLLPSGRRDWRTGITADGINASMLRTGSVNTQEVVIWNSKEPRFLWDESGLVAFGVNPFNGMTSFTEYVKFNHEGLIFQRNLGTVENPFLTTELSLSWDGLRIGAQGDSVVISSQLGLQVFDNAGVPNFIPLTVYQVNDEVVYEGSIYKCLVETIDYQIPTNISYWQWVRIEKQERIQIGRLYNDGVQSNNFGMRLKNASGQKTLETDDDGNLWLRDSLTIGLANNSAGITAVDDIGRNPNQATFWSGGDPNILFTNVYGPNFIVTKSGEMKATDGHIIGQMVVGIGTGNNYSGINGSGTIRFWAGALPENKHLAPFRVLNDGTLYATNAHITGQITATSGTFTGVINAQGGSFTNQVYIGEGVGSRIVIDGTNLRLSSDLYQSGVRGWAINGDGNAEFDNLNVRGAIKSTVFTYDEVSALGGSMIIAPSGVLHQEIEANISIGGSLMIRITKPYAGHPGLFLEGDTLKIQTHINDGSIIILWLKVNIGGINNSSQDYIQYTTTVLSNSSEGIYSIANNSAIPSGTAVVNFGKNGSKFIFMEVNDLTNGGFIDIIKNEGEIIQNSLTQMSKVRLGNLAGITDTDFDGGLTEYGLYTTNAYLKGTVALPNAGMTNIGQQDSDIRIWAGASMGDRLSAPFRVRQDGTMILSANGFDQMVFNPSTGEINFGSGVTMSWNSITGAPTDLGGISYKIIIEGNHIHYGQVNTTLSATIYKNTLLILKNGQIFNDSNIVPGDVEWFVGGTSFGTGFSKIFNTNDINTSAIIYCIYTSQENI